MVVDSSAVVAILRREPGWERLEEEIFGATRPVMSAAVLVETSIVIEAARGQAGVREPDALLDELAIDIVPFDAEQVQRAREGFRRFGTGRHPARLNFGDCLSYALARHLAEPLLSIGDDFARTDVEAALPPA